MKTMITKVTSVFLMVVLTTFVSLGQIQTTAPTLSLCPGTTTVSIPITVQNFSGVSSISLTLNYNPAVLTTFTYTSNAALAGGFTVANTTGGQIKAAWFGLSSISIPGTATLFTFSFTYLGGSCPLTWDLLTEGNCQYSDLMGLPLPGSTWVNGSINPVSVLSITGEPTSVSINEGENAVFSISSTTATTYQWQESNTNGASWNNLSDVSPYFGTQTNSLSITGVPVTYNNNQYRCIVTAACGQSVTSSSATLQVSSLCTDPIAFTVLGGGDICPNGSISIQLGNSQTDVIYTLYVNNDPTAIIQAGTGTVLSFDNISTAGVYTIYGTNACGTTLMDGSATATLLPLLSFNANPLSLTGYEGFSGTFSVATSFPSDLQWEVSTDGGYNYSPLTNAGVYSGVNTTDLNFSSATLAMNGYMYRCLASDQVCGQVVYSDPATLWVTAIPLIITTAPSIDDAIAGNPVIVPITVQDMLNTAAISLVLTYDPAVLSFITYQNLNPVLSAGFSMVNGNAAGKVSFGWFNITPVSLASGTLIEFIFNYINGYTPLTWNVSVPGNCQYSDINALVQNAEFINGYVNGTCPLPASFEVLGGGLNCPGGSGVNVSLSGSETNATYELFLGEVSTGIILSGTGLPLDFGLQTLSGNYFIVATNACGTAPMINFVAVISLAALEFVAQPISVDVMVGENATFYAETNYAATLQWQVSTNGGDSFSDLSDAGVYSGTSTNTLTITGADMSLSAFVYRCVATENTCNQIVYSNPAVLGVLPLPEIITTAPSIEDAIIGGTVVVPISVENVNEAAAISLVLTYDPSVLTYTGNQNLNPALTAGFSMINGNTPGKVSLGWFNIAPISIISGTLVEYLFTFHGGYTPLAWNVMIPGNCQYSDIFAAVMPATFIDGHVTTTCTPPVAFDVTGGGSYCVDGNGVSVGLNGSETNTNYELFNNDASTGIILPGTGSTLDFGLQTVAGYYTIVATNNCATTTMTGGATVQTNPLPVVTFDPLNAVCANMNQEVALSGYPAGGIFSGTGVEGNMFYPTQAGAGTFTLTYSFTDGNGCTNYTTQEIVVYPAPIVSFGAIPPVCVDANPFPLVGSPSGGEFQGPGQMNGIFYPSEGAGSYEILYLYVNENGCGDFATQTIVVNALPSVTLEPVGPVCIDAAPVALVGSPEGGEFQGIGINNNTFDPAISGVGTFEIAYTYTDGNGCSNFATQTILVSPLPEVTFEPVAALCVDAAPVVLVGSPDGGEFSGTGVVGNMFEPALAGPGTWVITYTYTDGNGCSNFATQTVTVNPLPEVYFEPLAPACAFSTPVTLSAYPAGGTFSGDYVTGNVFLPSDPGTYTLTYSYTDGNGCTNTSSQNITVNPTPQVIIEPVADMCVGAQAVTLVGLPEGGMFIGTGVVGNVFDPAISGPGVFLIFYSYTNEFGCPNYTQREIVVNEVPTVSLEPIGSLCIDAAPVVLVGSPEGGEFSGTGVAGNIFEPALAGAGIWEITYTYTNDGGCTSSATQTVTVNPLPVVNFEAIPDMCVDALPIALIGIPEGGFFSGPGVTGNMFDPAMAGVGTWDLTYIYSDGVGCVNSVGIHVVVLPLTGVFEVTGGGVFCEGTEGVSVGLSGSEPGILYNLEISGNVVEQLMGTGAALDFGFMTEPTTYTVYAIGQCSSLYMNGQATVSIVPIPYAFNVTGGGTYCYGGNGEAVGLDGSEIGVNYELYYNGITTGFVLVGDGSVLDFGIFTAEGLYTILATRGNCEPVAMNDAAVVAENMPVIANAGSHVYIFPGESIQLNGTATGGTEPYNFAWTPEDVLDNPFISNPIATPTEETLFTLLVTDALGCQGSSTVMVSFGATTINLNGNVNYFNSVNTPMDNTTVTLLNDMNQVVSTTITNINGHYEFNDIAAGTYKLVASSAKPWGGVFSDDALLILYQFTGKHFLTGLPLIAADVTGDGVVNTSDALQVLRRFAGFISSFAPGNWVFESPVFTLSTPGTYDEHIAGLCYGDVNKSYVPDAGKTEPTILLENNGIVSVAATQEVSLPVISEQNLTIGSVTFIMTLPDYLEVKDVVFNVSGTSVFNRIGNELRIGWYSAEPIRVTNGEAIFNLVVSSSKTFEKADITLDASSILSDDEAVTLNNVKLSMPSLVSSSDAMSLSCYPNPGNSVSHVSIYLPEEGNTSLKVYTLTGNLVNELVNSYQASGNIAIQYDITTLPAGVYFLKLEHNGVTLHQMLTVTR
ncbi:MAG: cohesin domain-containing protein [Bacteroidetes bacterium]|nr:cohesin domain-containing protein [Bacteroidota bacterium]